eukprot:5459984-Amphidinium_carterae.1
MHHLAAMFTDIRSGTFDPDASRSVILRGRAPAPPLDPDSFREPPADVQLDPVVEQPLHEDEVEAAER